MGPQRRRLCLPAIMLRRAVRAAALAVILAVACSSYASSASHTSVPPTHCLPSTVLLGVWPGNSSLLATRYRPGVYPGVIVRLGCDGYAMPSTKAGARSSSLAIWSTAVRHHRLSRD